MRAAALAFLVGCVGTGPGPIGGDDDDAGDALETDAFSTDTNSRGKYTVELDVDDDVSAFQVTGISAEWVGLEELYDPDGDLVLYWEDWYWSDYSLTDALYGYTKTTAFDWPIRKEDGPLASGTWTMVWSVVDDRGYYVANEPVDVFTAVKRDDDFKAGRVGVQIVYADGIDADPDVVAAVEEAVERWREVWVMYGLELDEHYVSSDIDPNLSFAYGEGDAEVESVAGDKAPGELQVVIGEQVRNSNSTYGVSAGIPGTIEATGSTFVVISWLVHAGFNAEFDADEKRLMGETMAHEVGHYTGLYHPVESSYEYWDALEDTPVCTGARDCEDALGTNVMFPYSICGGGSCLATDQLTTDQVGVVQRYAAAL